MANETILRERVSNTGGHFYPGCGPDDFYFDSDCKYGCGCWMRAFNSAGPPGVDPHGECPNNPSVVRNEPEQ